MLVNLVGKFSNTWGAEWLIKKGLEDLGHTVQALDISHSYAILRLARARCLTIVLQGYGLAPKLIESLRRVTGEPVVLWHAEVMSPEWPTTDDVVLGKAKQLAQNAYTFDAIGHNCHCCLETVKAVRGPTPTIQQRPVFWAPNNGVDKHRHYRIEGIEKKYPIGFYGYNSNRREAVVSYLLKQGIEVEWRLPSDGCYGEALNEFINQCHVMLNLHYSQTPNTECRLYESLGAGVPVISEPISMPELFYDGEICEECHLDCPYIDTFTSPEELYVACHYSVKTAAEHPEWLASAGRQGMEYLHANASYAQRCQNFIDQVRLHIGGPRGTW